MKKIPSFHGLLMFTIHFDILVSSYCLLLSHADWLSIVFFLRAHDWSLTRCGCLWLDMGGYGWLWLAMGGYGWLWLAMGGYGWLWLAMGGYGRLWLIPVFSNTEYSILAKFKT